VDRGDYQNARVYGQISEIDPSGKLTGHTSIMLRFDRLVMPDGRRAPIQAEIVELYHAPSGEKVGVEGAIESGGRGRRKSIEHTVIGAGAGALLVLTCISSSNGVMIGRDSIPYSTDGAGSRHPAGMDTEGYRRAALRRPCPDHPAFA